MCNTAGYLENSVTSYAIIASTYILMWNTFYLWRIQRRHKARFKKNLTKTKSWGRWVKRNTQKDFLVFFIYKIKSILSSIFLLNILNDAMGWMRQGFRIKISYNYDHDFCVWHDIILKLLHQLFCARHVTFPLCLHTLDI